MSVKLKSSGEALLITRSESYYENGIREWYCQTTARYRLAPQFPFPCGLFDCLGAYLYLLTVQDPSEIVLAGDSAGGGMIVRCVGLQRKHATADLDLAYL